MDSAYAGMGFSCQQNENKSTSATISTETISLLDEEHETELGVLEPLNSMDLNGVTWFHRMFIFYADAIVSSGKQEIFFPLCAFNFLTQGESLEAIRAILLTISNTKYDYVQFYFSISDENLDEMYKTEINKCCEQFNYKRKICFINSNEHNLLKNTNDVMTSVVFADFLKRHFADFTKINKFTPKAFTLYKSFVNKFILAIVACHEREETNFIFSLSNFEGYSVQECKDFIGAIISKLHIHLIYDHFYFINDLKGKHDEYIKAISDLITENNLATCIDFRKKISLCTDIPDEIDENATNLYITSLDCKNDINVPTVVQDNINQNAVMDAGVI